MGLLQAAYRTYENHTDKVGVILEGKEVLAPICHMVSNAQLEITITDKGEFQSAAKISSDDKKTIIPVTEDSATRSGKDPKSHPLCDQLRYLAPFGKERFDGYYHQLQEWTNSKNTHPKVQAIFSYIKRETIVKDLAENGTIELDGEIPSNGKIQGKEYGECLVRWRVIPQPNGVKTACWEDQELFDCYIKHFMWTNRDKGQDICYITGEHDLSCKKHPPGITSSPMARLISANDSQNFTYRGRFSTPVQAFNIGYTASQKAHNVLRWIVANYGVYMGGRTFLFWNPETGRVHGIPISAKFSKGDQQPAADFVSYRAEVYETISGYKQSLNDSDDVVISALEAATTGRLSVTYYNELKASDFFQRMEQWYLTCCCDRGRWGIQSPSIRDIVNCAFGSFREDKSGNDRFEADDKVLREHTQRLMHCVIERQMIPFDVVQALTAKAGNLQILSSNTRQLVLFLACAIIRKYKNDKQKREEWTLALDMENRDRSYLFGRLLAVAEQAERSTYKKGEERETNAIRMQSVFTQRPMYAWGIIEYKLIPYYAKLNTGLCMYYKNLIGEIADKISLVDAKDLRSRLDESYLLGYYQQRTALFRKKEVAETINNNTEETNNEHTDE